MWPFSKIEELERTIRRKNDLIDEITEQEYTINIITPTRYQQIKYSIKLWLVRKFGEKVGNDTYFYRGAYYIIGGLNDKDA